jgi:thiol peroxidase
MTQERAGAVKFKGNPVALLGPEIKVGSKAPDFRVVDGDLKPVTLADTQGRVRVFSVVPSLDTSVCSIQTAKFNESAIKLSSVDIYTVSVDLPFAQKRWCGAHDATAVKVVSDYQDRSFGLHWGTLLKDLKLLARAVFVVDKEDVVRWVQYVPEVTEEPDYDGALAVVKRLVG